MMRGFVDLLQQHRFWKEIWSLFKFGVVGGSSFLLNIGLYTVLSRWLWIAGPRTLEAAMAVVLASIYNFTLHALWTFGAPELTSRALLRYIIVALCCNALYAVFFFIGHDVFHLFDIAVVAGSSMLVACVTYGAHRWFTFHPGVGGE